MFLRPNHRSKDGKEHNYWSLVESVRTPDGPRQRTLCHLGELNGSDHTRWLRTVEVFNEQGEAQQTETVPVAGGAAPRRSASGTGPGQPGAPGKDATVRRLLSGAGTVETPGTGSFLCTGGGRRCCRCALVARGGVAGDQPVVRAGQRTGH